LQAILVSYLSI